MISSSPIPTFADLTLTLQYDIVLIFYHLKILLGDHCVEFCSVIFNLCLGFKGKRRYREKIYHKSSSLKCE